MARALQGLPVVAEQVLRFARAGAAGVPVHRFGVPVDLPLDGPPGKPRQPAVKRADDLPHYAKTRDQWERRSCRDGAKGERLYDWTAFAVHVKDEDPADTFTHRLVLRRSPHPNRRAKDGEPHREVTYFLVHAPAGTTVSQIIARADGRRQIEEDNEIDKQLVGLAQHQVRKWTPWHRHVTACMPASAFLAVRRAQIPEPDPAPEEGTDLGKDHSSGVSEAAG